MSLDKSRILESLDGRAQLYFGNKSETLELLKTELPEIFFNKLHQVHGNVVDGPITADTKKDLSGQTPLVQADGHWTEHSNIALGIQTADCLPVLAYHPKLKRIWALHAGWRSLVAKIIPVALQGLPNPKDIEVWIGPHIRKDTFQVQSDVVDKFDPNFVTKQSDGSYLVDLTGIAQSQLNNIGITNIQIRPENTYTDSQYHSFRREKSPGRQWSLIFLK